MGSLRPLLKSNDSIYLQRITGSVIVGLTAIMLWVHLSTWNYLVYWGGRENFILAMYSVGYKISCKIVRMTCIIIRDRLGTPAIGFQNANCFLRGRSGGATICLSLKAFSFHVNHFSFRPEALIIRILMTTEKWGLFFYLPPIPLVKNKISRIRIKWKRIRRIRYIFYIFW